MNTEVVITEQELPPDVLEAIRNGRKIEAIKLLRESKDMGLANAKVLVEQAWRSHGPERPIRSFEDPSNALSNLLKSLAMVLLVGAAWYLYTGA